jgi:hypothetical protein
VKHTFHPKCGSVPKSSHQPVGLVCAEPDRGNCRRDCRKASSSVCVDRDLTRLALGSRIGLYPRLESIGDRRRSAPSFGIEFFRCEESGRFGRSASRQGCGPFCHVRAAVRPAASAVLKDRIQLRRAASPVSFHPGLAPLPVTQGAERGVVALKCLEDDIAMERRKDVSWIGEPKSGLNGQSAAEARVAIENAIR